MLPTGSTTELVDNRLGSGSDYTVFLNHLGIPIADLTFEGPYGVYHSIYDNHHWVAKIGDPGFRYHVALVQLWGVLALRLAEADIIPLDYAPYASEIATYASELEKRSGSLAEGFADVRAALAEMERAARTLNGDRSSALASGNRDQAQALNRKLVQIERAFLEPAGIPGRPWYRHQIYAPKFTYAPELLPGVAEALDGGDEARTRRQLQVLAAAIRRAAGAMK